MDISQLRCPHKSKGKGEIYVMEIRLSSRSVVWKNGDCRSFSSVRRAVPCHLISNDPISISNRSRECVKCNDDIFRNRSVSVKETLS